MPRLGASPELFGQSFPGFKGDRDDFWYLTPLRGVADMNYYNEESCCLLDRAIYDIAVEAATAVKS